jgi:hypothetical protein
VAEWMHRLDHGFAVILDFDDVADSAKAYKDSGYDHIRPEYIKAVVAEVNSDEYPDFTMWERLDNRWTLEKKRKTDNQ